MHVSLDLESFVGVDLVAVSYPLIGINWAQLLFIASYARCAIFCLDRTGRDSHHTRHNRGNEATKSKPIGNVPIELFPNYDSRKT